MTKDEALTMALEALTYIYTETTADEDELIDEALTAIKEALAQPEQEPWLLGSTQTLAKNLARNFYPEVTQWECLDDLAGVISQIDNMTAGLMLNTEQAPVEYQMRMRPTWEATSWSDWKKCSRDAAGDYAKTPKLHDWEYETRKLYAQPINQAIPQIPQKDSSNEKRNNFLNGYCVGQADLLAEQAKQEPAAWMVYTQDGQSVYVTDNPTDIQKGQRALPLYTSPPQREWVGLTDKDWEEIGDMPDSFDQGSKLSKEQRMQVWQKAHTKTINALRSVWPVDIPLPEIN